MDEYLGDKIEIIHLGDGERFFFILVGTSLHLANEALDYSIKYN